MNNGNIESNILKYKPNWEETKARFKAWWNRSKIGRPMLRIYAHRDKPLDQIIDIPETNDNEKLHTDPFRHDQKYRNFLNENEFMAEAIPYTNINLGAGSMAIYLGSEPVFHKTTIWFSEIIEDYRKFGPLQFDPDNFWYKRHLELIKKQYDLARGEFYIGIPDIVENVDILSALRGPQNLCFDLMDCPETVKTYIGQIDDFYMKYYDEFYNIVKGPDGDSCFTAFNIWGPGKTAKLQCDFSAMMSPDQFREFVQPSLRRQCRELDYTLYHLDGPDAVRHMDALMEIEELDALQFNAGAGNPVSIDECWWESIYDKLRKAGKAIWISLYGEDISNCVARADRFIKRYGSDGLYFLFPEMTSNQGKELIRKAERDWG